MSASMLTLGILLQLHDRLTGPLKNVEERFASLHKTGMKLTSVGTAFAGVGLALGGVSARVRTNMAGIAESVIGLDDAAAKIRSMPDMTEGAVERTIAAARKWSLAHADTAESFADTSYIMYSAGLQEVAALAATSKALQVAKGTMGDPVATANTLALSFNNFGEKTKGAAQEIDRLGDTLTKAQQVFQIKDMNQLGEGIRMGTAAALAARVPFEDFTATLGQLNTLGLQGGMAGTAFSAMMRQLPSASKKLRFEIAYDGKNQIDLFRTLENLKTKFGDFSKLTSAQQIKLQQAFGDEGGKPLILLASNMDAYRAAIETVNNALGAGAAAQQKMETGAGSQMQIAMNNWIDFKRVFGTEILPILKDLLPHFKSMITGMSGFAKEHPWLVKVALALGAIVVVLAPLLSAFGSLMVLMGATLMFWPKIAIGLALVSGKFMALGKVIAVVGRLFLMNPIGLAVTLIAGGAYLIYKNWETLKGWFKGFFSYIAEKAKELHARMPGWMQKLSIFNWMKGDESVMAPVQPRMGPAAPPAGGPRKLDAGGEIRLSVEDNRTTVKWAKANDPRISYNIDPGWTMAGAN